jgi:hypothetical protein
VTEESLTQTFPYRLDLEEMLYENVLDKHSFEFQDMSSDWVSWDMDYPSYRSRKDAKDLCAAELGSRMGRRYRYTVNCCLSGVFGVSATAQAISWTRAVDWRVVKELEKCSA